MSFGLVSAAYVAAAVLFILSLGGLSGQESAKRAVWYGIAGMALAVGATVFGPGVGNYCRHCRHAGDRLRHRLVCGQDGRDDRDAAAGGGAALLRRSRRRVHRLQRRSRARPRRWPSTRPRGRRSPALPGCWRTRRGVEIAILRVEVFLGVFIGAVTFTGSIVAFGKLAGKVDGKARKLPGGHGLNAGGGAALARPAGAVRAAARASGRWWR